MKGSSTSNYNVYDGDLSGMNNSNTLCNIGANYWLATAYAGSDSGGRCYLRCVFSSGSLNCTCSNTLGVRPVVVLKSGVKTNNTKDTSFLSQTCWAVK